MLPPVFAALLSVVIFSTGGLGIKLIPMGPFWVSGFRSLTASIFLILFLWYRGQLRQELKTNAYGWTAAVAYAFTVTLFVISTKLTTAANAIFLQYTMPAWVLVGGAVFLKERVTWGHIASVLCCLTGMVLFFRDELDPNAWLGNSLALFSGFAFSVLTLTLRAQRDGNAIGAILLGNIITAVTNLPVAAIFSPHDVVYFSDGLMWLGILWLGIFQISIAYFFFAAALRGLPAIEVAIISLAEPVLNPVWVFLMIGETPGYWAMVGASVILLSVIIRTLFVRTPPPAEEPAIL